MLLSDPPDHTRLRGLLARSFTARRIAQLRPFVLRVATELLDDLAAQDDVVDLVAGFALPLPSVVISELLGVPPEDRTSFQGWTAAMMEGRPATSLPASRQLSEYLAGLIAAKSAAPGEDLLSALTEAGEDGDRLSAQELLATAILLLVAGHETTANLIGNGIRLLLTEPALAPRVRERPADLPAVLEELLRVDSPVMLTTQRFTAAPVDIGGVTIPAGEVVMVAVGSANRDADRFERAAEFDLDGDRAAVRRS
jgi:cytochrome P450